MSKPFILIGDQIDHGGTVVSGSPWTDVNGKPVARVNDQVICSRCGPTTIASGDPTLIIDGQPVARHGDKTACGAMLISGQIQVFVDDAPANGNGNGAAAPASEIPITSAAGTAAMAARYDEQLQFVNARDATLAGVDYRLELESGEVISGVTDAAGKTGRIVTDQPMRIVSVALTSAETSCCRLHAEQITDRSPLVVRPVGAATHAAAVGSSVHTVKTSDSESRGLTPGEIQMARLVFADSVDYSRVKVHNGEYLWFGMQPDDTAMTPEGEMYFNEKYFREDFSAEDIRDQQWFIHEMVHVWQHQLGYPVKARGAVRIGLSYDYTLDPKQLLHDYNMEAQGNIVADYFVSRFRNAQFAMYEEKYAYDLNALTLLEATLILFLGSPRNPNNLPPLL